MSRIEPVDDAGRDAAIGFLVAGAATDATARLGAVRMRAFLDERPGTCRLWQVSRDGQVTAAAALVENPGRTGMLHCSPLGRKGVDGESLCRLLGFLARDGVARAEPGAVDDGPRRPPSRDAGRQGGSEAAGGPDRHAPGGPGRATFSDDPRVRWRHYGQFDEDELAATLRRTYVASLDCPILAGLREIESVIVGHKASGVFEPAWWQLADFDGQAAGCALVNRSERGRQAELVYLGVAESFRRKGIGGTLLRRAIALAGRRNDALVAGGGRRQRAGGEALSRPGIRGVPAAIELVLLSRRGPNRAGWDNMCIRCGRSFFFAAKGRRGTTLGHVDKKAARFGIDRRREGQ